MRTVQPRILLSAYQCAPGQGSVSQIGWEWYSRLARQASVTLVTHIRNRAALEQAGAPLPGTEIIYIDTEWFAGKLYRAARMVFPKSEHAVFLLSSLDYFVYDRTALRQLRERAKEWDVVHVVTPVSPSAFTVLTNLGLPTVRGPLNGGLQSPRNFPEFMKADSAWIYSLRELGRPLRALFARGKTPDVVLAANEATETQLTPEERRRTLRMHEIAVDPDLYRATAWPAPPSEQNPLKVLFIGRLIPAKALPLLLEALRRLGRYYPAELTVIGDGPMRQSWQSAAHDLGASVRFLGACSQAQVVEHLGESHLLCLPSVRESGGAVLMEAMSAGRPVLAVDYGGPAGLVDERIGHLVSAQSPSAVVDGLTQALRDVFHNPDVWKQRASSGYWHALGTHTWNRRIQDGLSIYDQILASRQTRRAA
jgi:glycosyltransferase involved in cell wall biosynthesis